MLHHGSILQFGCYSFVFSLIDTTAPPRMPSASLSPPPPVITGTASLNEEGEKSIPLPPFQDALSHEGAIKVTS